MGEEQMLFWEYFIYLVVGIWVSFGIFILKDKFDKHKEVVINNSFKSRLYMDGIIHAELFVGMEGFSLSGLLTTSKGEWGTGIKDYVEYYENVLKDLVLEDKSHEEFRYNNSLDKKISERKDALKKYGFKENIRW